MDEIDFSQGYSKTEEVWANIRNFPNYSISSLGRIHNKRFDIMMKISKSIHGHAKVSLSRDGDRYTRSVAVMVAETFVEAPDPLCNRVIFLDGDLENVNYYNLQWRPSWYAWKYTRQLKTPQPRHFLNLPVVNETTGQEYRSIFDAGMNEGLLFEDIWRSTYSGARIYPYHHTFQIIKKGDDHDD